MLRYYKLFILLLLLDYGVCKDVVLNSYVMIFRKDDNIIQIFLTLLMSLHK